MTGSFSGKSNRWIICVFALLLACAGFAQTAEHGGGEAVAAPGTAAATAHETPAHDAHASDHGEESATPHLPNIISVILNLKTSDGHKLKDTHLGHIVHEWELHIFLIFITLFGIWLFWVASKLRELKPGRAQTFFEMVHQGFYNFLGGILGEDNMKYVPFLATLFMFIYLQNVAGIIPMLTGGTASYATTATLALMVFFYVQINGIREAGFGHWLKHFLGSPKDAFGWVIGVVLLPLEIIGTLAKPLSLSLRLFGNMMGEHILVGVFMIMGVNIVAAFIPNTIIGIPLHFPFMFLGLLTTFIQALVFTLLSTIYLLLLLPHDDHHADSDHDHHHDEKHGMRDDHHQSITAGDISPV